MEKSENRRAVFWSAWVLVIALGFWLRLHALHFYAFTDDGCEYVSALRDGYLPHSPYVLYYWIGWILHRLFPADIALSILSLSAGVALPLLLGWLVSLTTGSRLASLSAAAIYALSPVCVAGAGFVEIYPFQTALLLLALALAARGGTRAVLSASLVYGAAIATHTGSLFALPAFVYLLVRAARQSSSEGRVGSIRWRLLLAGSVCVLVLPVLAAGWLALLFLQFGGAHPWHDWLVYLRGIAPAPDFSPSHLVVLPVAVLRTASHMVDASLGWRLVPGILLLYCAQACWKRWRSFFYLWVAMSAPYLIYESSLHETLDRGIYTVFAAPAIAAFIAGGIQALFAWRPMRSSRVIQLSGAALIILLLMGPLVKSFDRGRGVLSRKEFFQQDLLQSARWMAQKLPRESYLVLPPSLHDRRWLACYSRLRGITYRRGAYRRFIGKRWSPLNASSFAPLSGVDLRRILDQGTEVVSVVADAEIAALANEDAGRTRYEWEQIPGRVSANRGSIYELVRTSQ